MMAIDDELFALTVEMAHLGTAAHSLIYEIVPRAPKFEFPYALVTPDLAVSGCDAFDMGLFPQPSEIFFAQQSGGGLGASTGMMCLVAGGKILIFVAVRHESGDLFRLGSVSRSVGEDLMFSPVFNGVSLTDEAKQHFEMLLGRCFGGVMAMVMALRCRDIIVVDCGPSPAIKKKREARGRPPLVEYKRLVIRPELRAIYESASADFARTSPRLHFRRGHARKLPSGAETYVSPCWVGNALAGEVRKDYVVAN